MFESLRSFLTGLSGEASAPTNFEANDFRLAAVALLVHIAEVDGDFDPGERSRLQAIVEARFGLGGAQARELIRLAAESEHDAVDLQRFTSVLKRKLSEAERRQVVAMLWEMASADGEIHEFEENVVKRIADLLGVSGAPELGSGGESRI
ncbi:MAG TPA: TerB family tellurite resistance protein [Methylocystis sp.]|nr:TerB family tellurite resistance protein [Methylocystis sp.]